MEENYIPHQEISHGRNSTFSYYRKLFPLPIQLISLRKFFMLCFMLCYVMLAKEFVEVLFCQNKLRLSGEQFFRVIIFLRVNKLPA